jgi:hypothetical protein
VIYRNSLFADHVNWTIDETPQAADVARHFLRSECELLRLARVATNTVSDLEAFLEISAELPVSVARSAAGQLLVRAEKAGETLLITGKTAEVLSSYIDHEVVRTEDRLDMTLRRLVEASA